MCPSRFRPISEILCDLDQKAPPRLAETWDPVGLLVGDARQQTQGVVLCVDLTLEAIQRACQLDYRCIITHHPCLFPRPGEVLRLTPRREALAAASQGIAVAAYHTNFDRGATSISDCIVGGLPELKARGRLGVQGAPEDQGYGVVGEYPTGRPWAEFLTEVRQLFGVSTIRLTTGGLDLPPRVYRVAFSPGKGSAMLPAVRARECDVFITGEVTYHEALEALRVDQGEGTRVLEVGHPQSERFFLQIMESWLLAQGLGVSVVNTTLQIYGPGGMA